MNLRQTRPRTTKETCEKCGKSYREEIINDIIQDDGTKIESERIPLCKKCFKKSLKDMRKNQRAIQMVMDGQMTNNEFELYKQGKISMYELDVEFPKRPKIKKVNSANTSQEDLNSIL